MLKNFHVWAAVGLLCFSHPLCAQKQFKYLPAALNKQVSRIPAALNPKLPLATQQHLARLTPVVQNTVTRTAAAENTSALKKKMLSGPQALRTYMPGWKMQMAATFTPQQLALIEQTFQETDQWLVQTDENGNWLSAVSDEWDYPARFAQLLTQHPVPFNESQLKTLFGIFSQFDDVFTRLKLQAFILVNGHGPRGTIMRGGKKVSSQEYTPEEQAERALRRKIQYNISKRSSSVSKEVRQLLQAHIAGISKINFYQKPQETLQQVRTFVEQHGYWPRHRLSYQGKTVRPQDYTPQQRFEAQLGQRADGVLHRAKNPDDPVVAELLALKEKYRQAAPQQTPQQVLEKLQTFVQKWQRLPRTDIQRDGRELHAKEYTPQEQQEAQVARSVAYLVKTLPADNPVMLQINALKDMYRQAAKTQSAQETLTQLQAFIAQHNRFPQTTLYHKSTRLSPTQYTPFQRAESQLAKRVKVLLETADRQDPAVAQLAALKEQYRKNAPKNTPQDTLQQLQNYLTQFGRWPRAVLHRDGKLLSIATYTPQERFETQLGQRVQNFMRRCKDPQHPVLLQMQELRTHYRQQ